MRVESEDVKQLAKDLNGLGDGHMVKDLHKSLRDAAQPIVGDIRAAVLAIPSKSVDETAGRTARAAHRFEQSKAKKKTMAKFERKAGLRETIARAVKLSVSATGGAVSIKVDASMLPDDQRMLPWDLEGSSKWRHPVYGRDVWVTQPSHPYFFGTIDKDLHRVESDVDRIVDGFAAEIAKG
jgi:hypothetical protein